jgi:DNA-binding NarL/FixJ family response regulator
VPACKKKKRESGMPSAHDRPYLITVSVLCQPHLASRVLPSFREMATGLKNCGPGTLLALRPRGRNLGAHRSGNSNKEIAKLLDISDQTVKNHITSILRTLWANDRTAAVICALKQHRITIKYLIHD